MYLVGNTEGSRPLGKPQCRWEDNNNIGVMEVGGDGVDSINLASDRHKWQTYVKTVTKLRVP
jgi:hypothetical protein